MSRRRHSRKRHKLRHKLTALYYVPGIGVPCIWCGKPVHYGEAQIHEFLVRRAQVPRNKQGHIFVVENCGLLHPQCHMEHDTDPVLKMKFLWAIRGKVTAQRILTWYGQLIAKGIMLPGPPRVVEWDPLVDYSGWLPDSGPISASEAYSLFSLLAVLDIDREEFLDVGR